jgi:hypothetical protein
MTPEEKQRLIGEMTDKFLADMTIEDKQKMVGNIMAKFFDGMTTEDKKRVMSEITPQIMEGFDMAVIMPQMLMAMMGQAQGKESTAGTMPMILNITGKAKESKEGKTSGQREAEASEGAEPPKPVDQAASEKPEEHSK